jgi:protein-arginine kinase activator protein McsA
MKTPIMIYDSILDQECIKTAIDLDIPEARQASAKRELTVEDLERKLETAIDEENYEMAARLRDEIKKRKAAAENKDDVAEAPGEE